MTQPVCLFALYDPSGRIPAHTAHYLRALAAAGFRLHIALNGVTALTPEDAALLRALGAAPHPRPNRGLDFGAWSALLAAGAAQNAPRVLLANDSVFGPFANLSPLLAEMDAQNLPAWGMVESTERVPHLQSWFLSLAPETLARPAIARIFAQNFDAMSKEEIILHGELGLSVALRAEHLAYAAVWPAHGRLRKLLPVNPSHFDFHAMLASGRVPFLKAELLRHNPANIAWIEAWRRPLGTGAIAMVEAALTHPPPVRPAPLHRRLLNAALTKDHALACAALFRPARA